MMILKMISVYRFYPCLNHFVHLLSVHSSLFTGHIALSLVSQCALGVDQGKQKSLPKSVIDVCRMVYQAKCSLIKVWLHEK